MTEMLPWHQVFSRAIAFRLSILAFFFFKSQLNFECAIGMVTIVSR